MSSSLLKQQILRDMGISLWVDRATYLAGRAESAVVEAPTADTPVNTPNRAPTSATGSRAATGSAVAGLAELNTMLNNDAQRAPSTTRSTAAQHQITKEMAKETAEQTQNTPGLSVPNAPIADFVCYWSASVVLFADLAPMTGRDRLVKDLLAAATGQWQQQVQQAIFRWADVGESMGSTQEAANKTVAAFVNKRVVSAKAQQVLVSHGVDDLVIAACQSVGATDGGPKSLSLPPLEVLASDAVAKRELWQSLVDMVGLNG